MFLPARGFLIALGRAFLLIALGGSVLDGPVLRGSVRIRGRC